MEPYRTWKTSLSASRQGKNRTLRWKPGSRQRAQDISATWLITALARWHGRRRDNLTYSAAPRLIQLSDPDVPEADWLARIAVCLQLDRRCIELLVKRPSDIPRLALQLKMILHQHPIKEDRDIGRCLQ